MNLPKKVDERLTENIKKYQSIIISARDRDVNESDTVTIVSDLLPDLFGYDKYTEVTREYAIKGTYCDLAIKIENKVYVLIEVKAIGLELKENHVRQAVDYAVNLGVDWVVLTNAVSWKVFKVVFSKPVSSELVMEFNLPDLSHRNPQHKEQLFLLTKEAINKSALQEFHALRQATNRYLLAAVILSDEGLGIIRRVLGRMNQSLTIKADDLKEILMQEVIKREVMESDGFKEAMKKVGKAVHKKPPKISIPKENGKEIDSANEQPDDLPLNQNFVEEDTPEGEQEQRIDI